MRLVGDGYVETACGRCGFAVRQGPARAVPAHPTEVQLHESNSTRALPGPSLAPAESTTAPIPRPLLTKRRVWIVGWVIAVYMMYNTVIGKDWYLPIYFAQSYLWLFSAALWIHRIEHARRYTEELSSGDVAVVLAASILAWVLAGPLLAPTIGERNYCWARASSWRIPPTVFRCTEVPVGFFASIITCWVVGWILVARNRRREAKG